MTVERVFVGEKMKEFEITQFLSSEMDRAGFSHADIKRTPMGTRVVVYAMRPGLVIGSGGENIKRVTDVLREKFKLENPHLEVKTVENPDLDAQLAAKKIAGLLERGYYFKKVAHKMLEHVMAAGARGVEIRISGKVPSERAKDWKFKKGYIRYCGEVVKRDLDVGFATARLKQGAVGVLVRLIHPSVVFPDEVLIGGAIDKLELKFPGAEAAKSKPKEKKEKTGDAGGNDKA